MCGGDGGVTAPQAGDAIGGGPAGRVGAAADNGGDIGVGQPGQVVIGDGLLLLRRQGAEGASQVAVELETVGRGAAPGSGTSATGSARRAAARVTSMALRCAMVTSHASTFAVSGRSG